MITRLELQGFKSFHKKTSIPLSKGFTAIVGPNGSGKSNVIDAICFVLGRTSAKSMRAERLTHLIYNGGKGKKGADFTEVSIEIDNSSKKLPFDTDTVKVSRRLTRNGTMTYRINNARSSRSQIIDVLSSSMFNPQGHNIVLQGDITNFIEMDPLERRGVIDEVSGIAEYDTKKEQAGKDLTVVESRIKELVIVMAERKKRVEEVKKEKEAAEKYKARKDEAIEVEANLIFSKFKNAEKAEEEFAEKLRKEEEAERELSKELNTIEESLSKNEKKLNDLDKELIKKGGSDQVSIKNEIEQIKGQISIDSSKIESKRAEISRLDSMIAKLQSLGIERDISKVSALKGKIGGIHGTVGDLFTVDKKYQQAFSASLGRRVNFIVVDNEDVAIKCIDYLKTNNLGRATFLPLNKIHGPVRKELSSSGVIDLALDLIDYKPIYKDVFSYALGNTHIIEDLKKTRNLIGKIRMVSLDGDLAEKSGAITGGFRKKGKEKDKEVGTYVLSRDQLIDEINELQELLKINKSKLEEHLKQDEEAGTELENLQNTRSSLESEISRLRVEREEAVTGRDNFQRRISDLRVDKARIDATLTDIKITMKQHKKEELQVGDIKELEERLNQVKAELIKLEPVNMKAIELYDELWQDYSEFEEKFKKLQEERKAVLDFIEEIESKKKDVFFSVFNKVAGEFENLFPKLSPNGAGRLYLENEEDPLSGGLFVEARPGGKKLLSLESMSGGEKVLTALAFLFALQKYKPAPFYILDEVDAALDQPNSMRFVNLLQEKVKDAQLLVITHNNAVVKKADRIFGVSMGHEGISNLVGLEMNDLEGGIKLGA